ncbi:uncharacterized protein LOC132307053 [Cornus florida]|uniref:uncharacterized protein LOC132307053 n=1 Tax=Cornus florida TaxID=4283 RepID=UPI002898A9AE|nr:uncharacterized protein LOC132307053 [Cornus florida]
MEDVASFWGYDQENVNELKQKLMFATIELETVRMEASNEMTKSQEHVKHLLQLLKIAFNERDEARDQLQKLLNKVAPSSTPSEFLNVLPLQQYESPLVNTTKANSSITESNSLSETYNYKSRGSSPVESLFDAVPSPELSNIDVGDSRNLAFVNHPLVQDLSGTVSTGLVPSGIPKIDHASMVIDNLAKGRTLPQKGKLLHAVLEAGPLLQTLLVAGPLPQWRNPPPLQPFQIPPVSIKGCDVELVTQKPVANSSYVVPKPLNSSPYVEMSCGTSQMLSTSMLNFASVSSGSCLGNGRLISAGANTNVHFPTGKRQRFQ